MTDLPARLRDERVRHIGNPKITADYPTRAEIVAICEELLALRAAEQRADAAEAERQSEYAQRMELGRQHIAQQQRIYEQEARVKVLEGALADALNICARQRAILDGEPKHPVDYLNLRHDRCCDDMNCSHGAPAPLPSGGEPTPDGTWRDALRTVPMDGERPEAVIERLRSGPTSPPAEPTR